MTKTGLMLCALLSVLLCASVAQAQTTYDLGTPITAFWSPTTNEATSVDRYEWKMDAGTYAPNGQAIGRAEYTQVIPQALLTVGAHAFSVRACGSRGCGPESSVAFAVQSPLPGAVPGLGTRPGAALVLNQNKGVEYAQAYALWAIDRSLTRTELETLALRRPNAPLTKATIAAVLNEAYSELAR